MKTILIARGQFRKKVPPLIWRFVPSDSATQIAPGSFSATGNIVPLQWESIYLHTFIDVGAPQVPAISVLLESDAVARTAGNSGFMPMYPSSFVLPGPFDVIAGQPSRRLVNVNALPGFGCPPAHPAVVGSRSW